MNRAGPRLLALLLLCVGAVLPAAAQPAPVFSPDETATLALAEQLYPSLFGGGGVTGTTQGYAYRFHPASGVYVGFKDSRLYLLGGPFGTAVQDRGAVAGVLGLLRVTQAQQQSLKTPEPVPQLRNLGIDTLANIAFDSNALREFSTFGLKGFYVFGDALEGGPQNPNFEYSSLKPGTKVVASIDGVVVFVRAQPESNDFEVFLQPRDGSAWTVGYDHLVNVTVQRGDVVKAGAVLGEPARQNNGLLRFEMQINQDIGSGNDLVTTHFCPVLLLAADVRDTLTAELTAMMNQWETFSRLELYDPARQQPTGCIKPTLTVAEASGRP